MCAKSVYHCMGSSSLMEHHRVVLTDKVRCNWKLLDVSKDAEGMYWLRYDTPSGQQEVKTRSVAVTMPAWALADLLRTQAPSTAEALSSFDYPPVAAVTLAYPTTAVREDRKASDGSVPGFGQLHPRSQVCGWSACLPWAACILWPACINILYFPQLYVVVRHIECYIGTVPQN